MLDHIESTIKNLPSISFEEFYMDYIDSVEDVIIQQEVSRLHSSIYGHKSINRTEKSIENLLKGVEGLL